MAVNMNNCNAVEVLVVDLEANTTPPIPTVEEYFDRRSKLFQQEENLGIESACKKKATEDEIRANDILQLLRRKDEVNVYGKAHSRQGHGGQTHERHPGDHFLSNRTLIERTDVFMVAERMPKGGHLHIHFNTNLPADFLLQIAATTPRMFINSSTPLLSDEDYRKCRIQFLVRSVQTEEGDGTSWDVFSPGYEPGRWMRFDLFLSKFHDHWYSTSALQWLEEKIVFHEEEVHGMLQTAKGAWGLFNARTQMMKGLFNYETAYRMYVRACLREFVYQNVQYAEVRVVFMKSNRPWRDDGSGQIDNENIVKLIIEECEAFQTDNRFFGMKIIYCIPRSFSPAEVRLGLEECLAFKQNPLFAGYIAGVDLVGEESEGKPLKEFIPQFLEFRTRCVDAKVDIPFLFHCGETLDIGTDTDGNLLDALLLGSKRIGHGFALPRHPHIMARMKDQGVCVELCPICNEVLGLTSRVAGHSMYDLLANNVHCTVGSDNGTLIQSTLSHDFYQVMVGKADMTLFGWRQLAEWSLDHSCMDEKQLEMARSRWEEMWRSFVTWIIDEYGYIIETSV